MVPREFHDFLLLLAFVRANADPDEGIHLDEVARRLRLPRERVMEYVARLSMCGRPPFSPEDLISIVLDDEGRILLYFELDQSMGAPIRLNTQEAAGLSLALRMLIDSAEPGSAERAESALAKITAALAKDVGAEVGNVAPRVEIASDGRSDAERLAVLRTAVDGRREVSFEYHSAYRDAIGPRRVRPYLLVQHRGLWYAPGEDVAAGKVKRFRLDRMRNVALLDATFTPPDDVAKHGVIEGRYFVPDGETVRTARVRFHPPLGRRLASEWSPSRVTSEPSGAIVATLEFVEPEGLANWLLGFAEHVEVINPPDLRDCLLEKCRAVLVCAERKA